MSRYPSKIPLTREFHPELDTSKFLNEEVMALYQSYMTILHWVVYFICIDLEFGAAQIKQYQSLPREKNLTVPWKIFEYMMKQPRSRTIFDATNTYFTDKGFVEDCWE